ncbi:MAG: YhbY family RNA-binding protein [Burkholderiales bacterium]
MKPLTPTERRDLRAKAHHLDPVVIVGQHGLTPPVLHEIDVALTAHELVKVRVQGEERALREAMLGQICAGLDCAPVQHLGKILVLWRPNPERNAPAKAAGAPARSGRAPARKTPAARTPVDPVRERRRTAAAPASGKGRRGAARNAPVETAESAPPAARRKSTYTPKTKPKSHSAKPNPRSAWQKPEPAATPTRRRRTRT